jgi:hypothetical protein
LVVIPLITHLDFGEPLRIEQLNRFVENVKTSIEAISAVPFLNGLVLQGVALAIGDNTIAHKLNRQLLGWYVVRQRAASAIFDKQDTNTMPSSTLVLNASAAVSVDIWVF